VIDPTAFRRACFDGDVGAVGAGLAAGCDAAAANAKGMTPLMLAVWHGDHVDVVRALLAAGAPTGAAQPSSGWTAATFAAVNGRVASLHFLLSRGADVRGDWKALHFAVQYRSPDTVPLLLAAGTPIDIRDDEGLTALHRAARSSDAGMVALLLGEGADPNAADAAGRTPLHVACTRASVPNVQALLAAGADADRADAGGATPRSVAADAGRTKIVTALG